MSYGPLGSDSVLSFDLHCHSTRSDGLLTPAAVARRAAKRGVRTLALTDHDETGGLAEARAHAEASGIHFINGVEISVTWSGRTLHIVGLNIDPASAELARGLESIRAGRHERAQRIDSALAAAGIPGTLAGAQCYVTNRELVGRAHFARYLVERGLARDVQSVFRRYLTQGKPGYVAHQWAQLQDAVSWIRASGGLAVLAHPGRYGLGAHERDALLTEFVAVGGAGVEVVTGSHSTDQYPLWAAQARRYGLLASVGSDFHGPDEGRRDFGTLPGLPRGSEAIWDAF